MSIYFGFFENGTSIRWLLFLILYVYFQNDVESLFYLFQNDDQFGAKCPFSLLFVDMTFYTVIVSSNKLRNDANENNNREDMNIILNNRGVQQIKKNSIPPTTGFILKETMNYVDGVLKNGNDICYVTGLFFMLEENYESLQLSYDGIECLINYLNEMEIISFKFEEIKRGRFFDQFQRYINNATNGILYDIMNKTETEMETGRVRGREKEKRKGTEKEDCKDSEEIEMNDKNNMNIKIMVKYIVGQWHLERDHGELECDIADYDFIRKLIPESQEEEARVELMTGLRDKLWTAGLSINIIKLDDGGIGVHFREGYKLRRFAEMFEKLEECKHKLGAEKEVKIVEKMRKCGMQKRNEGFLIVGIGKDMEFDDSDQFTCGRVSSDDGNDSGDTAVIDVGDLNQSLDIENLISRIQCSNDEKTAQYCPLYLFTFVNFWDFDTRLDFLFRRLFARFTYGTTLAPEFCLDIIKLSVYFYEEWWLYFKMVVSDAMVKEIQSGNVDKEYSGSITGSVLLNKIEIRNFILSLFALLEEGVDRDILENDEFKEYLQNGRSIIELDDTMIEGEFDQIVEELTNTTGLSEAKIKTLANDEISRLLAQAQVPTDSIRNNYSPGLVNDQLYPISTSINMLNGYLEKCTLSNCLSMLTAAVRRLKNPSVSKAKLRTKPKNNDNTNTNTNTNSNTNSNASDKTREIVSMIKNQLPLPPRKDSVDCADGGEDFESEKHSELGNTDIDIKTNGNGNSNNSNNNIKNEKNGKSIRRKHERVMVRTLMGKGVLGQFKLPEPDTLLHFILYNIGCLYVDHNNVADSDLYSVFNEATHNKWIRFCFKPAVSGIFISDWFKKNSDTIDHKNSLVCVRNDAINWYKEARKAGLATIASATYDERSGKAIINYGNAFSKRLPITKTKEELNQQTSVVKLLFEKFNFDSLICSMAGHGDDNYKQLTSDGIKVNTQNIAIALRSLDVGIVNGLSLCRGSEPPARIIAQVEVNNINLQQWYNRDNNKYSSKMTVNLLDERRKGIEKMSKKNQQQVKVKDSGKFSMDLKSIHESLHRDTNMDVNNNENSNSSSSSVMYSDLGNIGYEELLQMSELQDYMRDIDDINRIINQCRLREEVIEKDYQGFESRTVKILMSIQHEDTKGLWVGNNSSKSKNERKKTSKSSDMNCNNKTAPVASVPRHRIRNNVDNFEMTTKLKREENLLLECYSTSRGCTSRSGLLTLSLARRLKNVNTLRGLLIPHDIKSLSSDVRTQMKQQMETSDTIDNKNIVMLGLPALLHYYEMAKACLPSSVLTAAKEGQREEKKREEEQKRNDKKELNEDEKDVDREDKAKSVKDEPLTPDLTREYLQYDHKNSYDKKSNIDFIHSSKDRLKRYQDMEKRFILEGRECLYNYFENGNEIFKRSNNETIESFRNLSAFVSQMQTNGDTPFLRHSRVTEEAEKDWCQTKFDNFNKIECLGDHLRLQAPSMNIAQEYIDYKRGYFINPNPPGRTIGAALLIARRKKDYISNSGKELSLNIKNGDINIDCIVTDEANNTDNEWFEKPKSLKESSLVFSYRLHSCKDWNAGETIAIIQGGKYFNSDGLSMFEKYNDIINGKKNDSDETQAEAEAEAGAEAGAGAESSAAKGESEKGGAEEEKYDRNAVARYKSLCYGTTYFENEEIAMKHNRRRYVVERDRIIEVGEPGRQELADPNMTIIASPSLMYGLDSLLSHHKDLKNDLTSKNITYNINGMLTGFLLPACLKGCKPNVTFQCVAADGEQCILVNAIGHIKKFDEYSVDNSWFDHKPPFLKQLFDQKKCAQLKSLFWYEKELCKTKLTFLKCVGMKAEDEKYFDNSYFPLLD